MSVKFKDLEMDIPIIKKWAEDIYKDKKSALVLAEKETHVPMEQKSESKIKSSYLWTNNFWQRNQIHSVGKTKPLQ